MTHITCTHHQYNLPPSKKLQYASNRDGVSEVFTDAAVRYSVETDLRMLGHYDDVIGDLQRHLEQSAKVHDANSFFRLQTIPGVGRIIAMTMLPCDMPVPSSRVLIGDGDAVFTYTTKNRSERLT
jgi:hypothetical protein